MPCQLCFYCAQLLLKRCLQLIHLRHTMRSFGYASSGWATLVTQPTAVAEDGDEDSLCHQWRLEFELLACSCVGG